MNMVYQIRKKLHSGTAETLTETLVSVLIISIVSVGLATMIAAASRINEKAREYDKSLDDAIQKRTTNYVVSPEMAISVQDNDKKTVCTQNYKVAIYGDSDMELYSYTYPDKISGGA